VWFDALLSYLTGAGFDGAKRWEEQPPAFRARWANAHHLIGKDILKPHAIFWPTMLRAMGFPPYRSLHVHGYWKVDDRKVSKSLGNMISPLAMRERYGFEAFRWFLLREMSFGLDASFTEEALVERANADLANNVGNLVSRTLNLVEKLCGGSVPEAGPADDADRAIEAGAAAARERIATAMGAVQPHLALAAIVEYASDVNRYVDARAPWRAAKDPALAPSARTTLHVACRALAALAELLGPFVPAAAAEIGRRVGAATDGSLPAGARVTKGDALFRRLEKPSAG
jgi:methionyl-tRNA synthetase